MRTPASALTPHRPSNTAMKATAVMKWVIIKALNRAIPSRLLCQRPKNVLSSSPRTSKMRSARNRGRARAASGRKKKETERNMLP